jgi:hypothetical protein
MYFTAVNQPLKVPIYNVLLDVERDLAPERLQGGLQRGRRSHKHRAGHQRWQSGQPVFQCLSVYAEVASARLVKSITLPSNRNVVLLSITMAPPSVVDIKPLVCGSSTTIPAIAPLAQ